MEFSTHQRDVTAWRDDGDDDEDDETPRSCFLLPPSVSVYATALNRGGLESGSGQWKMLLKILEKLEIEQLI